MDTAQLLSTLDTHLSTSLTLIAGSRTARFDGGFLVASGVPVPDFNIAAITDTSRSAPTAAAIAADLLAHDTEAIVIAPSTGIAGAREGFTGTDITEAGTAPLMVVEAGVGDDGPGDPDVRELDRADSPVWGATIADTFTFSTDVCDVLGAAIVGQTSDRIYGLWDDELRSTVWCTGTGPVRGIWGMATPPAHQRKGYGARVLAEAIRRETRAGGNSFFLIATEQGEPLYRRLGFETLDDVGIWVRGDSPEFAT